MKRLSLKSLSAVAIFILGFLAPVLVTAQTIQATGGVNYGNGAVVRESSGNGIPSSSCTGLVRYTQLDATSGSNLWQCINGTMVQQGGGSGSGGSACDAGSPTGQCTINKQLNVPNLQTGSAISGNTATITNLSTIPANWTLDVTTPTTAIQSMVPGIRYSQGYKTGGSCNGIANAFAASASYGITVVADPAYCSTEVYNFNALTGPAVNNSQMIDYRNGHMGEYYRNPGTSAFFNSSITSARVSVLQSDLVQNAPTGAGTASSGISTRTMLWEPYISCAAPGMTMGNLGFGPSGWTQCGGINLFETVYQQGLAQPVTIQSYKTATGDFANYIYHWSYGGTTAPSDQGNNMLAINGGENNTTFKGTIATGGAGATTVTVNATVDANHPGDGRILMKTTAVTTGVITAKVNPSGNTPGNFTVDQTYTPSTAWGTLNGNCLPDIGTTFGVTGSSKTCNVTMLSGTFSASDHVCFAGNYWEQAVLTGATSTSITASLRHQHGSGTWVMANGPCGQVIDIAANDVTGATLLHYPFPVIGATGANTLQWARFSGGSSTGGIPGGNFFIQQFAVTNLNNIGGVVYFTASSFSLTTPYMLAATITISGATVSTYNGACTNLQPVPGLNNGWKCTQAGSVGAGNSAAGTIAYGTTGNGNTAYSTYYGSEVLDVQSYGTNPPQVCPSSLCTLTLEPNPAVTWTAGDAVEEAHHYSANYEALHLLYQNMNPESGTSSPLNLNFSGNGVSGGNPAFGATFAVQKFVNLNANSMYQYSGGTLLPPGGIMFRNGLFNYAIDMINAPAPNNAAAIAIGCPASGCTDINYAYNFFTMSGNGSTAVLNWKPFFNELTFSGAAIVLNSDLGKQTFRDNVTFSPLAAPVGNTPTPSTSGGNLADLTQRCFTVVALNNSGAGRTAQSTEKCTTTGTSGGNNSITFTWARVTGATGYMVCGGPSGAELNMPATLNGPDATTFVDNGSITPSGACQTTDTSTPSIIGPASIQLASSSTAFLGTVKAPAGVAGNYTLTLPAVTGTVALNSVFVASGASHATGLVPDPGSSAGTTRFLREDSTWVAGPVKYTPSLTPSAVTASTCSEQTFTVTGVTTGQAVLATNPPSALSHVWIGYKRVSAANTVAIEFCADATGGTPPTGTWVVVAY